MKLELRDSILDSMLDDDLYKFNMGQVVFHDFPEAVVTYEFINRGKTEFPPGFADALKWQIEQMAKIALTKERDGTVSLSLWMFMVLLSQAANTKSFPLSVTPPRKFSNGCQNVRSSGLFFGLHPTRLNITE